ncbi:MAG TPA: alpha/beta fold hydrolase [Beijerinckiaceae bacterium]|nr:alpha/beta fold hydrolase [Beijerinckiaceae bacterium]
MTRDEVSFPSSGVTCRGWLFRPAGPGPHPAVIMANGMSATKAMGLQSFAESYARRGLAVLAFDYRGLGESDGAERGRLVPQEQHDDTRAAIRWLRAQPGIDAERIALWGFSFSGGHAVFLASVDPRVKAVAALCPAFSVLGTVQAVAGAAGVARYLARVAPEHDRRATLQPSGEIAIVAPKGQPCLLGAPGAHEWFTAHADAGWRNATTQESVARMADYAPEAFVELIAPKPILVLAARQDRLVPLVQIESVLARAGEPKRLLVHDGGHFDFLPGGPLHETALEVTGAWLGEALGL